MLQHKQWQYSISLLTYVNSKKSLILLCSDRIESEVIGLNWPECPIWKRKFQDFVFLFHKHTEMRGKRRKTGKQRNWSSWWVLRSVSYYFICVFNLCIKMPEISGKKFLLACWKVGCVVKNNATKCNWNREIILHEAYDLNLISWWSSPCGHSMQIFKFLKVFSTMLSCQFLIWFPN